MGFATLSMVKPIFIFHSENIGLRMVVNYLLLSADTKVVSGKILQFDETKLHLCRAELRFGKKILEFGRKFLEFR